MRDIYGREEGSREERAEGFHVQSLSSFSSLTEFPEVGGYCS